MPKVSVIIPTYNRANYICEAIDSVLNQTFQDFEIIVVDDGSTDNTREVLEQYNKRIKYFYKTNGGEASARNLGVERSNGEYIAFLDSDDLWLPDKLKKQMTVFEKNSDIGLVYAQVYSIDKNGHLTGQIKPAKPARNLNDLLDGHRISMMTVVVKKTDLLKAGLFDKEIKVAVDTDMWIRLARNIKIDFIEEPLAKYRWHSNNISNSIEEMYLGHIKIFKKILTDNSLQIPKRIKKLKLAREYYLLAKEQSRSNKHKECLYSIINSIKVSLFVGMNFINLKDSMIRKALMFTKPYIDLVIYGIKFLFYNNKK